MYPPYILALLSAFVFGKATIDSQIDSLEKADSPLLKYPTQLTQNIVPKQIHSHNDCTARLYIINRLKC